MDASLIKKLKDMTNAGLMDCKKALEASNEDIDEAVKWLREKGISKAAKKADRIAAEGSSVVITEGNNAVIVELNCETDFVSANEKFTSLLDRIAKTIINSDAKTVVEALELKSDEGTVNDDIINVTATMGEKISLRRFVKVTKSDNEVFGKYIHMGGKISALCLVEGTDENVANDVAMHLAAMNPKYVDRDSVPGSVIEEESKVLKEQAVNEGKPEEIAEKMVQGRINKFYGEICLMEQEFVKNPDMKINKLLESKGAKINNFARLEKGEGIEKVEENFAEEVAKQIKM